jgi:hypothetical protein
MRQTIGRRMLQAALGMWMLAGVAEQAGAAPITVLNPSFENPVLGGPSAFTNAPIPNWAGSAFRGVFWPTAGDTTPVPDGNQVAYIFGAGAISQDLGVAVQIGATYQLDLWVGTQSGFAGSYLVRLLAGGSTVLAASSGTPSTTGSMFPVTLSGSGAGSGNVSVELDSTSGQVLFDMVQVQVQTSGTGAPEPATTIGVLLGLAVLWRWRSAGETATPAPAPSRASR